MTGKSVYALSATGNFGRYASEINSSASNTPPTKKKYRARGIRHSIRPLARTTGFQLAIIDRYQAPMRCLFVLRLYGPRLRNISIRRTGRSAQNACNGSIAPRASQQQVRPCPRRPESGNSSKHERLRNGCAPTGQRLRTDLRGRAAQPSCASARRVARKSDLSRRINVICCPVPLAKRFRVFRNANHPMWFVIPSRKRGVCHRHERWDGLRWTRQCPRARCDRRAGLNRSLSGRTARRRTVLRRTAKACGPDASAVGVKSCGGFASPTGADKTIFARRWCQTSPITRESAL